MTDTAAETALRLQLATARPCIIDGQEHVVDLPRGKPLQLLTLVAADPAGIQRDKLEFELGRTRQGVRERATKDVIRQLRGRLKRTTGFELVPDPGHERFRVGSAVRFVDLWSVSELLDRATESDREKVQGTFDEIVALFRCAPEEAPQIHLVKRVARFLGRAAADGVLNSDRLAEATSRVDAFLLSNPADRLVAEAFVHVHAAGGNSEREVVKALREQRVPPGIQEAALQAALERRRERGTVHTGVGQSFEERSGSAVDPLLRRSVAPLMREVEQLLGNARRDPDGRAARHLLETARRKVTDVPLDDVPDDESEDLQLLTARVYRELAFEAENPLERANRWRTAMRYSDRGGRSSALALRICASIAIDAFQDDLALLDFADKQRWLRRVGSALEERLTLSLEASTGRLRTGAPDEDRQVALLLASRSAVLRHQAMGAQRRDVHALCDEAVRCAQLSIDMAPTPEGALERGLAEFAAARRSADLRTYVRRLEAAESYLLRAASLGTPAARLSLARFYRMTYRSLDCCASWPYNLIDSDRRRLLRDSFVLGEAVAQLHYADYPRVDFHEHFQAAQDQLEQALAAGFGNARLVTALAVLNFLADGAGGGEATLSELIGNSDGIDWRAALTVAMEADPSDPAVFQFALGIADGRSLTRLGTFVADFLDDKNFGLKLYRAAVRHRPTDPVCLTNLARVLAEHPETRLEARRLLERAANRADRRFTWWRSVRARLDHLEANAAPVKEWRPEALSRAKGPHELHAPLNGLRSLPRDERESGALILIPLLVNFEFGLTAAADDAGLPVISMNAFDDRSSFHYVVVWPDHPAGPEDVDLALAAAGGSGSRILFGMSGFDPEVRRRATQMSSGCVLLVDSDELSDVLGGANTLFGLIRVKLRHWDTSGDPYHQVVDVRGHSYNQ